MTQPRQAPRALYLLAGCLICGPALRAQEAPCPGSVATPSAPVKGAPPSPGDPGATPAADEARARDFVISSDRATVGTDGNALLSGSVEVRQGEREIHAAEIQYDASTRSLRSTGAIDYQDPLVHLSGSGGNYSPEQGTAFRDAQFELRQRAARGSARSLELTPNGVLHLGDVRFTTCTGPRPAWQLRASDITLDPKAQVGTGHGTSIEFAGVPFLWLPWVSFPLGSDRKSGFLFPTLGNNSRSGAQLAVPWYWNIAPNADLTFEPVEYSRRGPDVAGEIRFLTGSQKGSLDWDYLPYDDVHHGERSRVRLLDTVDFARNVRLTLHGEDVSDTQYFQDFAQGPEGTSTAFLEQRATLSYRDDHWRADLEAQHWQTIDDTLAPPDRPYARVPRIAASGNFGVGPGQLLHYGIDSELVDFQRGGGIATYIAQTPAVCTSADLLTALCGASGWRLNLRPTMSLALDAPGIFVHPGLAWDVTRYALNDLPPGVDRNPARSLPIASLDTGLVFERDSGRGGSRLITLEPRLMYLYVPYRVQDNLPVFDTARPDLNPVELFRVNRYVGLDRIGDADQVNAGVTSRLIDTANGQQYVSATVGESFYFRAPRVTLPAEAVRTDRRSDFVAQLALGAGHGWSADLGLQWDPQASRSDRLFASLQYRPAPDRVVNLAYRYQRDLLPPRAGCIPPSTQGGAYLPCSSAVRQLDASSGWQLTPHWSVFAREVYSLLDSRALESFAGFEYRGCCWGLRLGGRRFVSTRTGAQDTGVFLELELIGLASVGSASNAVLRENIRGYVPGSAKTGPPDLKDFSP